LNYDFGKNIWQVMVTTFQHAEPNHIADWSFLMFYF